MENPPSIQGAGPRGSNFSHPQYPRQAVQATARLPYFSVGFFLLFWIYVSSLYVLWVASIVDLRVFWQPGSVLFVLNCRDYSFFESNKFLLLLQRTCSGKEFHGSTALQRATPVIKILATLRFQKPLDL